MQKTFGISGTLLGVLASAYFYPYAVMQLPTGLLVDVWGPRNTVSTFFLLAAAGSVLIGMAPTLSAAILGRILVGVGVSTLYVSNFKLLAEWFSPRQFVIMGGIFMAMGGIGALSASAPLAWVSNRIGWRMTLIAVGSATLVMTFLLYAFVRNRPSDIGWSAIGPGRPANPKEKIRLLAGVRRVVSYGGFWPISVWVFLATGISFALGGLWGGPYLMHVYGMNKLAAGGVLSMFAAALIVGSPLVSMISNRIGRKPVFIGGSIIMTLVCFLFYIFTDRLSLPVLYLLFFLLFFAGGAIGPLATAVAKELFPLPITGTAIGILNLFPFFGGALFQVYIGTIVSRGGAYEGVYLLAGYQEMFFIFMIGALISFVAALFFEETLTKNQAPSAAATMA